MNLNMILPTNGLSLQDTSKQQVWGAQLSRRRWSISYYSVQQDQTHCIRN